MPSRFTWIPIAFGVTDCLIVGLGGEGPSQELKRGRQDNGLKHYSMNTKKKNEH